MKRRPLVRSLLASAAVAAAAALAGCDTDGVSPSMRSLQPLSQHMLAEIEQKNMSKESPILVRIFKEESELEVWKQDKEGRFALLKTYPICRWSGELGPKIKEGDRQAPEGFYAITPSLMNPNSNYYLAINTGFPNAYDRANGRSGALLMIHGDCSSSGCYAMTDEQIAEIYALARESFFGGQRSFQIQAYPFRMTPLNMAKHRDSPNMAFWRMIKQGYDHFEVTHLEPKVDVCEKHYVFDAETSGKFSPAGACPAYKVDEELAAAVKEKQQRDDRQMAELVSRGTPTVPVRTGTDGGMNRVFLAAFQKPYTDGAGVVRSPHLSLPGTIPPNTRPPGEPNPNAASSTFTTASSESKPALPASDSQGGSTASSQDEGGSGGMFSSMKRLVGLTASEPAAASAPAAAATPAAKPKPAPRPKATQVAAKPKLKPVPKPDSKPDSKPDLAKSDQSTDPEPKAASSASLLNGAQPALTTGSFESRWGQSR